MTTQLHDTGPMDISGPRGRIVISKTTKGINVDVDSLYSDEPRRIRFYRDGNYPTLPASDADTTAVWDWYHYRLSGYNPDRVTRP